MVDCDRLLDQCVAHARAGHHAEVVVCFDLIFALLRYIDEGHDDVLFFADEGGSDQVGVDWRIVLPAWFSALAATAEPGDFAAKVTLEVDHHVRYDRERYLNMAREAATRAQQQALDRHVSR